MRLADGHEATIDAWQLLKRRRRPVQFVALPTVMDELASKLADDSEPVVRAAVEKALRELRSRWRFQPADFNAVQDAIAVNAMQRLRDYGLIPYEERNASIVAEAAVLNCVLLVSRDSHLTGIDHDKLALLLRQLDLAAPIIATPETLLKKFYPK
jgi:hypothetical protein